MFMYLFMHVAMDTYVPMFVYVFRPYKKKKTPKISVLQTQDMS